MSVVLLVFFCIAGNGGSMCDSAVPQIWFQDADQCEAFAESRKPVLQSSVESAGGSLYLYRHSCLPVPVQVLN